MCAAAHHVASHQCSCRLSPGYGACRSEVEHTSVASAPMEQLTVGARTPTVRSASERWETIVRYRHRSVVKSSSSRSRLVDSTPVPWTPPGYPGAGVATFCRLEKVSEPLSGGGGDRGFSQLRRHHHRHLGSLWSNGSGTSILLGHQRVW